MTAVSQKLGILLRLTAGLALLAASTVTMAQGSGCGFTPTATAGLQITPFAPGFTARAFSFGGINFICHGPGKGAFGANRSLIVPNAPTGTLYRFDTGGGPADAAHVLNATPLNPGTESVAIGRGGRLYATQVATTGSFLTGSVVELDPVTGDLLRTVAANITCANGLAVDPLSGDLFVSDSCAGAGSDNPAIWRIVRPASASPTVSIYATTAIPNTALAFAPDGTLFLFSAGNLVRITGTNKPQPASVTTLPGAQFTGVGLAIGRVGPDSSARSVYMTTGSNIAEVDLTTNPIRVIRTLINSLGGQSGNIVGGPDRCLYISSDDEVLRLTNSDGSCNFVDTQSRLNIADTRVTEGNAGTRLLVFTVTLSPAARGPVSVRFATANGTARSGPDYVALSRTLNFSRGESAKRVSVSINGDAVVEKNETFLGNLRSPSGATIVDGRGLATIGNDD